MAEPRKYSLPPSNKVYVIDGASYGLDDRLVEAIKDSIGRKLTAKTLEVPRLPQVASRIMQLSGNPDTSVDDVVQVITTDPIMATRMLAIANSAAYNSGSRFDDLRPALLRLGTKVVSDTVFAESVRMKVFSAKSYRAILERSWKLSLGTALACDAISRATGIERSSAFLMGLLHETGTPVLVSTVAEYERQNRGVALGEDLVEILITQLHEEVGAHVLVEWGMSDVVVGAALAHHQYRGAGKSSPGSSLVHAGNLVCRHLGIGGESESVAFNLERVFTDLKLGDTDAVAPILETVQREFDGLMAGLHQG